MKRRTVHGSREDFPFPFVEWMKGTVGPDRDDGPALEWEEGQKEWYVDGKRHREDGPAVEYGNGYRDWWVGGMLRRNPRRKAFSESAVRRNRKASGI